MRVFEAQWNEAISAAEVVPVFSSIENVEDAEELGFEAPQR